MGLLAVDLIEPVYRRAGFSQHLLAEAMSAPALRRQHTDDLLHNLGDPAKRPTILACESVQQRYGLDERFVIRSLDGRTDRALFSFVHAGKVDHIGYFKLTAADFLTTPVSYDRAPEGSFIERLSRLPTGKSLAQGGLLFRRMTSGIFAVLPSTSDQS